MFRAKPWARAAGVILFGVVSAAWYHAATAQEPGLGAILGGYGAMTGAGGPAMGGGFNIVDSAGMGGVIVPAVGGVGVAMAPAMRGVGPLFQTRSAAAMTSTRGFFSLDSMGGMSRRLGGRRAFTLQPSISTGGMGVGGGMRRMPAAGSMGVMPPSFGYPFRQPPSLVPSSVPGAGMSM